MWQTVDYKGNIVKWYEAELIENIKTLCDMNKCTLSVHIMALIDVYERTKNES